MIAHKQPSQPHAKASFLRHPNIKPLVISTTSQDNLRATETRAAPAKKCE